MNTIAIEKLNTEEKIYAMEQLWDDLCHNAEEFKTPEWHKKILDERMKLIQSGKAEYSDWDDTKNRILKIVS
jgi:hypothetical protein